MDGYRCACVLLMWSIATTALPAQPLVWKFEKGQIFHAERTASQTQTVELKGKTFKQQHASTWHVRLDVKDKLGDDFRIQATLTKVEHESSGGADTDKIDPKLHEKMQGAVFTLDVSRGGKLVKLQGYDEFLKRLGDGKADRLKALRVTLPEAAVKEALADLFGPLPAKDIVWKRDYVEPIPHFGSLRSTAHYEHTGRKKGLDMIYYRIDTKYDPPAKDDRALFRITKGSIDTDKAQGTIAFDNAAGHLFEHHRTMTLRGKLTIEAQERRETLEFTSENEVKIRVTR